MKLQTHIPLQKAENQIDYKSRIALLGSCFVENMGRKMDYYKIRSLVNPFGILFHPKAIETLVSRSINQEKYVEEEIFYHNERWHCFDAHSHLSHASQEKLITNLNEGLKTMYGSLVDSTHIIITLGTSWIYRNKQSNSVVANCHKVSQNEFSKELLSVKGIVESLGNIIDLVKGVNPNVQFIFTVSPIRHLKDGFVENQRSKAHLISAIHHLTDSPSNEGGRGEDYFPSYELMMDELRDYRFYEEDMLHPNELAINYIWEKFKKVWISENAFSTMDEIAAVQKGLFHNAFNPDSESHLAFQKSLRQKITSIQTRYPFIHF